eukprot:3082886-Amphidinium_carterae.2
MDVYTPPRFPKTERTSKYIDITKSVSITYSCISILYMSGGPWKGAEARSFARVHPMYRLASTHRQHSTYMPPL